MYYRIFVSDKGQFRNAENYEYVAEFAHRDFVEKTVRWMGKQKRYSEKDIIVKEVEHSGIAPKDGKVTGVITALGESFPIEEYEFS